MYVDSGKDEEGKTPEVTLEASRLGMVAGSKVQVVTFEASKEPNLFPVIAPAAILSAVIAPSASLRVDMASLATLAEVTAAAATLLASTASAANVPLLITLSAMAVVTTAPDPTWCTWSVRATAVATPAPKAVPTSVATPVPGIGCR